MTPLSASDAALIKRAKDLAMELAQFLEARELARPSDLLTAPIDTLIRDGSELQATYAAEYGGRVRAIIEAFRARGVTTGPNFRDFIMDRPTNPLGVQEVMRELGYLAMTLELLNV